MLRIRLSALVVVTLTSAFDLDAQSGSVRGIVVDSAGQPIARAQVISNVSVTETGRDGRFRLSMRGARSCSFTVFQAGFARKAVTLDTCPDTAVRVVLRRALPGEFSRERPGPRCGSRTAEPCTAPDAPNFMSVSAGYTHTCALTREGAAWCWGDDRRGALGVGSSTVQRWPQRLSTSFRFVEIGAGGDFTCARTEAGEIYCWGTERVVPGWPRTSAEPTRVVTSMRAAALSVGRRHACLIDGSGKAACWGWNVDGETGTGTAGVDAAMVPTPSPVAGDHAFRSLSAGSDFTCGVTAAAEILCWGSNVDGVIGDAATDRCGDVTAISCATTPVSVSLPDKATVVSSGLRHACAVVENGDVFCWGANDVGQLGVPERGTQPPRRVALKVRARTVHSGGIHSCALSDRDELHCWGADSKTISDLRHWAAELPPGVVSPETRFASVSPGPMHLCALDRGGRVLCWGDTILGALGAR